MKKLFFIFIFISCAYINAQNPLSVVLSKQNKTCLGGLAGVNVSGGVSPYKIKWNTGDSNLVSINHLEPGNYTVSVQDYVGADTIISFSIESDGCLVGISNHFTPNDDGYNDTWYIGNISYYPNFELFVYNRSGQLVYHQSENYIPWDGTWLGMKVPDATYYYIFYFNRSEKHNYLKGDLTILR